MTYDAPVGRPRLFVEGAVIVASILLAFGIEALWSERQVRSEEREALVSLHVEFEANLEQIERVIAVYVEGRAHMETLVRLSADEVRSLPQSTISAMMLATSNPWTFDAVMGTTGALVRAGRLAILRDRRLREALTTFMNRVEDAAEDIAFFVPSAEAMWLAEIRHGGPWTDPETEIGHGGPIQTLDFIGKATADDLLSVRADVEFMGLVSRFYLNAGYYVQELESIRTQIELILDLVAESP